MKKIAIVFSISLFLGVFSAQAKEAYEIQGYKVPKICLKDYNRCILKKLYSSTYWCVKSDHQRTLDTRRTTQPIKKTTRENIGHCTTTIPIQDTDD
ncbi:MAG: hypothetical protein OEY59_02995 [Deltaproteobacteria bacterium]|nr:hypothetical protein [Deltaproteobacteria bacterium]